MNDAELKEKYAQEPWGKLLLEMGREPYDTESSARSVAEYAAERIEKLENERDSYKEAIKDCLEYANGRQYEWGSRAENAFGFLESAMEK